MALLSHANPVKRMLWAAALGLVLALGAITSPMASADTDSQDAAVTIVGGAIAVTNTAALDLTDSDGDDPSWSEDAQLVGDVTCGTAAGPEHPEDLPPHRVGKRLVDRLFRHDPKS